MSEEMNELEVLQKARALLARPGGWRQGSGSTRAGQPLCALHAIAAANRHSGRRLYDAVQRLATELYQPLLFSSSATVISWNDAPGRTQGQVLDLFDHAIRRLGGNIMEMG